MRKTVIKIIKWVLTHWSIYHSPNLSTYYDVLHKQQITANTSNANTTVTCCFWSMILLYKQPFVMKVKKLILNAKSLWRFFFPPSSLICVTGVNISFLCSRLKPTPTLLVFVWWLSGRWYLHFSWLFSSSGFQLTCARHDANHRTLYRQRAPKE